MILSAASFRLLSFKVVLFSVLYLIFIFQVNENLYSRQIRGTAYANGLTKSKFSSISPQKSICMAELMENFSLLSSRYNSS